MITGIVIGLIIGGLAGMMCTCLCVASGKENNMYTLGCIACFGFVVVIIAALLDL